MKNLIEALNDPKAKVIIEKIEDLESSLESYPKNEDILEEMLITEILNLLKLGYNWGE